MPDHNAIVRRGAELLDAVEATSLPPGQLAFWWLGQHSFILRLGAAKVFIDAYLKPDERRTKPPMLTPEECGGFDLFLCTHDHGDHLDPWAIPQIAEVSRASFVVPRTARERMLALGVPPDQVVGMNADETVTVAGVTITAVRASHEFLDETPDGLFPFLGYVLEGNGVRAYHSGDTLWWEGLQSRLRALLPLDVAFVPINGRDSERYLRNCLGNLSFAEAVDLVGALAVGLAVPTHFDMFTGNSEDPLKFTAYLEAKYPGVPHWLGPAGETVVVTARR
ncbi:MAG: MBL fold metallo-hydrolase [Armatimonadetes bacterium]|nr:MBL fold metallo-hydrolase [Armatimonadota bacterium]